MAVLRHEVERYKNVSNLLESYQLDTLLDPCMSTYDAAFSWVIKRANDGGSSAPLHALLDWILSQCSAPEDLFAWILEVSSLIYDRHSLQRVRVQIIERWPDFFSGMATLWGRAEDSDVRFLYQLVDSDVLALCVD